MKKWEDMTMEEQRQIKAYFTTWLNCYTHEVIVKVMEKAEEIINDAGSMKMLEELHKRTTEERDEFYRSIGCLFDHFESNKKFDPHNHPLTHAGSYRDVLYDMYIR